MHYSDPKPRANEDWLCNKVFFASSVLHTNCIGATEVPPLTVGLPFVTVRCAKL